MIIKSSSGTTSSAKSISNNIDSINKSINLIENYLKGIQTVWQGADATSFVNKFNSEALVELRKYVTTLREYQNFLSQVCPIYEALEEAYNKPINTN